NEEDDDEDKEDNQDNEEDDEDKDKEDNQDNEEETSVHLFCSLRSKRCDSVSSSNVTCDNLWSKDCGISACGRSGTL
ncbi:unnamed protein product, partial [Rotaria magnacalcarata]